MKRWLCWLLLVVGVIFLVGFPHRPFARISLRRIDRCSARTNSFPSGAELCGLRMLHSLAAALAHSNFSRRGSWDCYSRI